MNPKALISKLLNLEDRNQLYFDTLAIIKATSDPNQASQQIVANFISFFEEKAEQLNAPSPKKSSTFRRIPS